MDKDLETIFNKAGYVKLSPVEKEKMQTDMRLFLKGHPVRMSGSIRLIVQEKSKSYISVLTEMFTLKPLINILQPMAIVLIIALLIGGGASFAAESALPGDILYSVKANVNEHVLDWIAVSDEAQAALDARLAGRRLEEAEKLAAEGRLDATMRAEIKSRFESRANAFEERAKKIESKESTKAALEINSDFEAALKTHEQVLAQMAAEKSAVGGEAGLILLDVRSRLNSTTKARSDAEMSVSADASVELRSAAEGKLGAAENKISEVRNFITQKKSSISVNASTQAEARLKVAEEVIARGKTETEAQSYGKAFTSFQEALRIAQEAKLLVAGEERIRLEIKVPNIGVGGEGETQGQLEQKTSSGVSTGVESTTKVKSGNDSTEVEGRGKLKVDIGL